MRSPPGTSPTPVWPAASRRITRLRVKNGACAPLRFRSMLSRPATGMTSISVIAGAAFLPGRSLRAMNLLTPAVPAADGITAVKGNGDLASLDSRLHLNSDHCRLGEDRTCHASRTGGYGTEKQAGKRLDC